MLRGRIAHEDITKSPTVKNETAVGRLFHYFTGGALALTYPALVIGLGVALPDGNAIPSVLWGLGTGLLPWLVLFPGFGWGAFGTRAPGTVRPWLAVSVEHSLYGLGLGLTLDIAVGAPLS